MERKKQTLDEILSSLKPLEAEWCDDIAQRVIDELRRIPEKSQYDENDVTQILNNLKLDEALLIFRLFLGLSKDQFTPRLQKALVTTGSGTTRSRKSVAQYVAAMMTLGICEKMQERINAKSHWSDVLIERLRSGRGSAISGIRRGRNVEDFVEDIVKQVFPIYDTRCLFVGSDGRSAKCDFAIPEKTHPRIIIEAKGYAATGSKMTDVLGDITKIMQALRRDTVFLLVTDGITWNQRQSDLRKIVEYQNNGDIARIYTTAMVEELTADLISLKAEYGIGQIAA